MVFGTDTYQTHRTGQIDTAPDLTAETVEVISRWRFAGTGYSCRGDEILARTAADNYWSGCIEARLERRTRLCAAGS